MNKSIFARTLSCAMLLGSTSLLLAEAQTAPAPLTPAPAQFVQAPTRLAPTEQILAPTPIITTTPLVGQEALSAVAWVQTSTEAKIAARQAYRLATRQLDVALRDKKWSAAVEQVEPFKKLPPAIILDLDETVLDNSFYNARLVRDNAPYTAAGWASWVAQSDATAISGAVPFLQYAASKGVQIFYISNRGIAEEAATRVNLQRLGCPIQGPDDHVLMNAEHSDWTTDKTTRRRFVAQTYRVLLLVGDDMNDFLMAKPLTLQQRSDLLEKYDSFWGERWILLSNPIYGSWEGAIYGYRNDLSRQEMLRLKYGVLQYREPATTLSPLPGASSATR